MNTPPKVGIGAYIVRGDTILLGWRLSQHAGNAWSAPGGHHEYSESPTQAASREAHEETGLAIPPSHWHLIAVTNDIFPDSGKHYVTLHFMAHSHDGEPAVTEPDHWREWRWFPMHDLPKDLMPSFANALAAGLRFDQPPVPIITNFQSTEQ